MDLEWRNLALVAVREYLENVRTRGFWLSILLLPVLLLAAATIPVWLTRTEGVARFAVVDASGWAAAAVRERIQADDAAEVIDALRLRRVEKLPAQLAHLREDVDALDANTLAALWSLDPEPFVAIAPEVSFARFREVDAAGRDRAALNRDIETDALTGYFVLPEDPVASGASATYVTRRLTNPELRFWYQRYVTDVVRDRRIREENVDPDTARWIQEPVRFAPVRLTAQGEETEARTEDMLAQWAPVAFVYFLWISIFAVTQMLLTNTVEEKSNRLVEVLLSSLAAVDLMAGKIVGIAATGLTIVATWLAIFLVVVVGLPHWLDAPLRLDLGIFADNPLYLGSFVLYFVLGYLFYAAVLCALGSLANNLKEAQTLMMPVQICLVIPLLVMIPIGRDPNGTLAAVLSWVPPFTPFVMMNRAAFPPGAFTYAGTTLLMLVSIYLALRLAARVFATGILMTGQPPRLRQILHLVRKP
jgi:ABC-2 type transport system permease protein